MQAINNQLAVAGAQGVGKDLEDAAVGQSFEYGDDGIAVLKRIDGRMGVHSERWRIDRDEGRRQRLDIVSRTVNGPTQANDRIRAFRDFLSLNSSGVPVLGSGAFGTIRSTRGGIDMRELQFSLKLVF